MKLAALLCSICLLFIGGAGAQQLKLANGHEGNPYYSNKDTRHLNGSKHRIEEDFTARPVCQRQRSGDRTALTGRFWNAAQRVPTTARFAVINCSGLTPCLPTVAAGRASSNR